jgi:hypothetical protein
MIPNLKKKTPSLEDEEREARVTQHDAVFGEITEEGPNYRNVCAESVCPPLLLLELTLAVCAGRLDGHHRPDDEDADWPRRPLDTGRL